jgi:hypothetical protein
MSSDDEECRQRSEVRRRKTKTETDSGSGKAGKHRRQALNDPRSSPRSKWEVLEVIDTHIDNYTSAPPTR